MANFERLIKGALASQDSSSSEVRQVIYQSSRNALQKIIDNNRSLTVEAVMEQKRKLEISIAGIEAEFVPGIQPAPAEHDVPAPQAQPEEFTAPPVTQAPTPVEPPISESVQNDPLHEIQQILEITPTATSVTPEQIQQEPEAPIEEGQPVTVETQPQVRQAPDDFAVEANEFKGDPAAQLDEYYTEQENVPLGFSKRRKTQKRFFWTLIVLIILGLLAWIAYIVVTGMFSGSLLGQNNGDGTKLNPNSISRKANSDNYITVIESSDLSSLVTAQRGKAQIIKELNVDMIRINSVRDALNRSEPALPVLIKLKPGVLKQISGKRVTVEIFAKAGGSETAHFAVGCEFGTLTECGRKRFLAGSQPNASVFAFQMDRISDINQDMYLTLSTDTTSQSAITGKGDVLDIVYIRLSLDN